MSKSTKKKAAAGALALLTAASVAAGSLFDSPAALLPEDGAPSIVYNMPDGADDDAGSAGEDETGETRRGIRGARAALRQRILRLPLLVRLLVILPLWVLGSMLLAAAGAVWPLLQPILSKLGLAALTLAVLGGAFLLAAKTVFPDLPLKKIFSRRGAVGLLLGASALAAADAALPYVWADYAQFRGAAQSAGLFFILACAVVSFALREQRRRRESPTREKTAASEKPQTLLFNDGAGTFKLRVPTAASGKNS